MQDTKERLGEGIGVIHDFTRSESHTHGRCEALRGRVPIVSTLKLVVGMSASFTWGLLWLILPVNAGLLVTLPFGVTQLMEPLLDFSGLHLPTRAGKG